MKVTLTRWNIGRAVIPFHMGHDCAAYIAEQLAALNPDRLLILADSIVWQLNSQRYEPALAKVAPLRVIAWPAGEVTKTLTSVENIAVEAIAAGLTRRSVVIGIGGGVIGNLAGMTAALLYRGIRLVHVPTTLLAMHDSVTSLKQGVNASGAKNILGTFHTPSGVFIDLQFLESLPKAHIRAGLAELIKNGLVLGGDYLAKVIERVPRARTSGDPSLYAELIEMGISAKSNLMREDACERGKAMIMEYGHTIGHAIELCYAGQLNHGDSITWGMRCAAWVSEKIGHMSAATLDRHEQIMGVLGPLPRPTDEFRLADLVTRVQHDNKRGYLPASGDDSVAMVLLREPGAVINSDQPVPLTAVRLDVVRDSLEMLQKSWKSPGTQS